MQVPVELKLKYLERRDRDLLGLKISLEKNDFSFAMRLGHQVKGNAVTFDFPNFAHLGLEIEKAAKRKDKEKVIYMASKLESAISAARESMPPVIKE